MPRPKSPKKTNRAPRALPRCDLVFEGGGVKGIGLVGAYSVIAQRYEPANVAGTSAGAIVGALIAAGYSATELRQIVEDLDYLSFLDTDCAGAVPLVGPLYSVARENGLYAGRVFENLMRDLLKAKNITTFGDLVIEQETDPRWRYRLNVIAADITNQRLVVLPQGARYYGLSPDRFEVATAVRMSMSLPFVFKPVYIGETCFVDGGLLSSFPVWLFDSDEPPQRPTFGVKLLEPEYGKKQKLGGPIAYVRALIDTMLEAHDNMHVEESDIVRTIGVYSGGVQTTDFAIPKAQRRQLYGNGVRAATKFFDTWDFPAYRKRYREHLDRTAQRKRQQAERWMRR